METVIYIFIFGFVRGKEAYLRRDYMNILNLTLLIVELLYLTPLSENATFSSISKVRALRILFMIQLVYLKSSEMKLIFHASINSLSIIVILTVIIILFFNWINILEVKLFKDQDYYCDNAFTAVKTKQECFEWGGDWVKENLNLSSIISAILFGIANWTMEGWIYDLMGDMDLTGKDNAPQYNANEHIQIFYPAIFFFGGIILWNFFVSSMLVNYRRTKEELSGEKHLSEIQKKWLSIKSYILLL